MADVPLALRIVPTATITTVAGQPVRLWEGTTDEGIPCRVFVARVAVARAEDCAAFDRALRELPPPREYQPLRDICP